MLSKPKSSKSAEGGFENMGYISGDEGYTAMDKAIQPPAPIITEAASEEELEPVSNPVPLAIQSTPQSASASEANAVLETKPSISDDKSLNITESVLTNEEPTVALDSIDPKVDSVVESEPVPTPVELPSIQEVTPTPAEVITNAPPPTGNQTPGVTQPGGQGHYVQTQPQQK